jgi:hypothetical protein
MSKKNEYQGGAYAIFEFIGLYVRFYILKSLEINRSIKYLSGEEHFPKNNKKQQFFCLSVGILSMLIMIFLISLLILKLTD